MIELSPKWSRNFLLDSNMSPPSTLPNFAEPVLFADRAAAGATLAAAVLTEATAFPDANFIVYALPRGGMPIGLSLARALHCPLAAIIAKKITRPHNPELAIGAVTADNQVRWRHTDSPSRLPSGHQVALQQAQAQAQVQLAEFAAHPHPRATGAIALLVDDGIATGMTIAVAAQALRAQQPQALWICVPVAPGQLMPVLQTWCDRLIVLATPDPFLSVSRFYQTFDQVSTATAIDCLVAAAAPPQETVN